MRKRSATISASIEVGQTHITTIWTHDHSSTFLAGDVVVNLNIWPGLAKGDVIQVSRVGSRMSLGEGFMFLVNEDTIAGPKSPVRVPCYLSVSWLRCPYLRPLCLFEGPTYIHSAGTCQQVSLEPKYGCAVDQGTQFPSEFTLPHLLHRSSSSLQIDPAAATAGVVEVYFRDMYLGRKDMWLMISHITGSPVYAGQKINFFSSQGAVVKKIYINGLQVSNH